MLLSLGPEMSDWRAESMEHDGIQLRYTRTGDGTKSLLVLCHGLTDNGLCWTRTAETLQSEYDIIMLDARNHGESGSGPADLRSLTADISAVIKSTGIQSALVMGHSVGAATAAAFAAHYPEQITALVLEDPPWKAERPMSDPVRLAKVQAGFEQYISHLQKQSIEEIIAQGKQTHRRWHDDEFPAWAASKKQVRSDALARLDLGDWHDYVGDIVCPALLVHGDQDNGCDGLISAAFASQLKTHCPLLQIQHIPMAGHNLRREQFDSFLSAVTVFLEGNH